jgi:hypothetical protein
MSPHPAARWLTVRDAAPLLSMSPDALRRSLERYAVRAPDGGIEANIDGLRARKLGRLWRVMLAGAWAAPITGADNTPYRNTA